MKKHALSSKKNMNHKMSGRISDSKLSLTIVLASTLFTDTKDTMTSGWYYYRKMIWDILEVIPTTSLFPGTILTLLFGELTMNRGNHSTPQKKIGRASCRATSQRRGGTTPAERHQRTGSVKRVWHTGRQ